MPFQPDYRHMLAVLENRRPERLPVYEHIISPEVMETILDASFKELIDGESKDVQEYFRRYTRFFRDMTYDTVSVEVCIGQAMPGEGALRGGVGPIQNRADFNAFPWREIPDRFWNLATPRFDALRQVMPEGMKAVGGVGNGVFEISEYLVGYECLSYMQIDDPELFADLYARIGDLMVEIWDVFLERYGDVFAICRFGDDLGFKTGPLVAPSTFRTYMLPQYRRVIDTIHRSGKPFLWHSCGNIFDIMEDVVALGIDAKHSNEDVIAPYEKWIELYGDRIGLLGGIDVDILCHYDPDRVRDICLERGRTFRQRARGYALGSGNSIPEYVPADGYVAMIEAARCLRAEENTGAAG